MGDSHTGWNGAMAMNLRAFNLLPGQTLGEIVTESQEIRTSKACKVPTSYIQAVEESETWFRGEGGSWMMMYVLEKRAIQTKKPFYSAKSRAWSEVILARAVIVREAQVKEAG